MHFACGTEEMVPGEAKEERKVLVTIPSCPLRAPRLLTRRGIKMKFFVFLGAFHRSTHLCFNK